MTLESQALLPTLRRFFRGLDVLLPEQSVMLVEQAVEHTLGERELHRVVVEVDPIAGPTFTAASLAAAYAGGFDIAYSAARHATFDLSPGGRIGSPWMPVSVTVDLELVGTNRAPHGLSRCTECGGQLTALSTADLACNIDGALGPGGCGGMFERDALWRMVLDDAFRSRRQVVKQDVEQLVRSGLYTRQVTGAVQLDVERVRAELACTCEEGAGLVCTLHGAESIDDVL